MDSVVLSKLRKFVGMLVEDMDADQLGYFMVKADLQPEELGNFLDRKSPWIYESPNNGKTVYRRHAGKDDRELLEDVSGVGC